MKSRWFEEKKSFLVRHGKPWQRDGSRLVDDEEKRR